MTVDFVTQSDRIFREFRWEYVHKAMTALNWEWSAAGGVPDIARLKETAYALLKDAYERNTGVSTGGFTASYDESGLGLTFCIESAWGDEE